MPCHNSHIWCCNVLSTLLAFFTYCGTSPKPMNWQTTSCIRPQNPPCGRRALPQNDCAGSAEWFRCHRQELLAVFPGYFQLGWLRELVSCSRARIGPGNRQIPASLRWTNKYTKNKCHNIFNSSAPASPCKTTKHAFSVISF